MATKNRSDLKSYFVKNAIPTEGNFADLVDSQLNQAQDGVFKPDGEALSVVAAPGDQKRLLRLYASYPAASPDWMISLHPAQDPANAAATGRTGFGITDGAGNPRLFIDAATGKIGVGTNTPQVALDVAGSAQANGFRGRYDLVLNDYRTVNPASNTCLQSPANDRDAWIYRDPGGTTSNWGIYHRQIDSTVGGLPANSIGFVGGSGSTLQAYVNLGDGSGYFAGRLGIGTTAPQASLHVTNGSRFNGGRHYFTDEEGTNILRVGTAWGIPGLYSDSQVDIVVGCTSGRTVHLGQPNKVTIVDGRLTTSSYMTCLFVLQTSDGLLKNNIETIPGALDKIVRLRGVSFDWRAEHRPAGSQTQLGLVAQEVRQVVPEAVIDAGGSPSIVYNAITALLVEAVKEQQKQIDELRSLAPIHA